MSEVNESALMYSCTQRCCAKRPPSSWRLMIIHNRMSHHGLFPMTTSLRSRYKRRGIYDTNTNFKCFDCDLTFTSWNGILDHSETTEHKVLYSVYVFDSKDAAIIISPYFDKHIARFSSWDSIDCSQSFLLLKCPICDETLVSLQEYHDHLSTSPNCKDSIIDNLKCRDDLRNIRVPEEKSPTSITSSDVIINDNNRGNGNNLITTNMPRNQQYICQDCKDTFNEWESCEKHIRDKNHMKGNIDSSGRELRFQLKKSDIISYRCTHCFSSFSNWRTCRAHLKEQEKAHGYFNNIDEVKRTCSTTSYNSSIDDISSHPPQPSPSNNTTTRLPLSTPLKSTLSPLYDNDATNNNIITSFEKRIASSLAKPSDFKLTHTINNLEDPFELKYVSDDEEDMEEDQSSTSKNHMLSVEKHVGYFDSKKLLEKLCLNNINSSICPPSDFSPQPISNSPNSPSRTESVPESELSPSDYAVSNEVLSLPSMQQSDSSVVPSIPVDANEDTQTYGSLGSSSSSNRIPNISGINAHNPIATVRSSLLSDSREIPEGAASTVIPSLVPTTSSSVTSDLRLVASRLRPLSVPDSSADGYGLQAGGVLGNQSSGGKEQALQAMHGTAVASQTPREMHNYNFNDSINPNLVISNYHSNMNNIQEDVQKNGCMIS